jgi:hypothetical protein
MQLQLQPSFHSPCLLLFVFCVAQHLLLCGSAYAVCGSADNARFAAAATCCTSGKIQQTITPVLLPAAVTRKAAAACQQKLPCALHNVLQLIQWLLRVHNSMLYARGAMYQAWILMLSSLQGRSAAACVALAAGVVVPDVPG